jgi:hypothetical protein
VVRGFAGLAPLDLVRSAGVAPDRAEALVAELLAGGELADLALASNRRCTRPRGRVAELEGRISTRSASCTPTTR